MHKVLIPVLLLVCFLPACSHRYAPKSDTGVRTEIVDRELTRSRAEILSRLSDLQSVTTPRPPMLPANATAPYDLSYPAKLLWEGPIEQGLASLGRLVGWQARRYGPTPVQDVMVFCDPTDTGFEIIQKFQAQAGSRARIIIDEGSRTLKLVYGSDIAPEYRRSGRGRSKGGNRRVRPARPKAQPAAQQPKPQVPSSHKPELTTSEPAPKPAAAPAPAAEPKVESDIVRRSQPHKERSSALIEDVLGAR